MIFDFIREHQLNIMLSLASICFIILIFLLMTNFLLKEKKKALLFFVFSAALLLLTGRYSFIFQGKTTESALILAKLFKYLMFFNMLNVVYGFGRYIKSLYIENHPNLKLPIIFSIVNAIIIVGHIFLIISQFTNLYYSYDMYNVYHREKWYFLCYMFPLVATLSQYIIVVPEFRNTKKYIYIPLMLYFILPIIAAIIQLFIPGLSIVIIIIGGVVIILYSATIYDANIMLKEKEKAEADLRLAREIQQNEMPNTFPAFPNRSEFDLYAIMNPAKEVGGDFYDYFLLDDNHLGIVIADVSGKGVPAALNMFKTKILLKGIGLYINNPAKVLGLLNDNFIDNNKLDMFVTIWFGILEIKTGKLIFANAGHEDLIIFNEKTGYNVFNTKHDVPIGTMNNYQYENYETKLNKGDKIFLYTDGIIDTINNDNKQYGIDNLLKVLNENRTRNVKETISAVNLDLVNYSDGCVQFDDITMLSLELKKSNKMDKKIYLKETFKADVKEINRVFACFGEVMSNIIGVKKVQKYYVVIDEIFSNIAKYAYKNINDGRDEYIIIDIEIDNLKKHIKIMFEDNGVKFNPLTVIKPNTELSVEDRKIGGLGIYIVKEMMGKVSYEYKDEKNILIIENDIK